MESLLSVLKQNVTNEVRIFYRRGQKLCHQGNFLDYQKSGSIVDILGFDPKYEKAPSNTGFSWGYSAKKLFRNGLEKLAWQTVLDLQLKSFQTRLRDHITRYRASDYTKLEESFA